MQSIQFILIYSIGVLGLIVIAATAICADLMYEMIEEGTLVKEVKLTLQAWADRYRWLCGKCRNSKPNLK